MKNTFWPSLLEQAGIPCGRLAKTSGLTDSMNRALINLLMYLWKQSLFKLAQSTGIKALTQISSWISQLQPDSMGNWDKTS